MNYALIIIFTALASTADITYMTGVIKQKVPGQPYAENTFSQTYPSLSDCNLARKRVLEKDAKNDPHKVLSIQCMRSGY